jgi:DNA mismatch endonuclease, patch repair protein
VGPRRLRARRPLAWPPPGDGARSNRPPGLMAPTPNLDGFWWEPASELEGLVPAAQELAEVAAGLPECEPAGRLAERLGAGRFLVSVVGEYKRGKSTLIQPAAARRGDAHGDVLPLTSVATELAFVVRTTTLSASLRPRPACSPVRFRGAAKPFSSTPATCAKMQAHRRRDTAPELLLRSALHSIGLRYWVHRRPLPGVRSEADVLFPRQRVAVFVDGCFWHRCPEHGNGPQVNQDYWDAKLARNADRDRNTDARLATAGWTVVGYGSTRTPLRRRTGRCDDSRPQRGRPASDLHPGGPVSPRVIRRSPAGTAASTFEDVRLTNPNHEGSLTQGAEEPQKTLGPSAPSDTASSAPPVGWPLSAAVSSVVPPVSSG